MINANAGRAIPNAVLWAFAALPLVGFWLTGLFDLDEGFYAAVVSEMLQRGEWITPFYNGEPWFEKPILLYWLAMPMVSVFGEMVGPRLPSVLCTLGVYWAVWSFTRRFVGEMAAGLALMCVSTSLLVAIVGRLMMTDLPLVLGEILAFLFFYRSLYDGVKWRWGAAFFLGVSVLAKGPVGCAFFVALVGITYWQEPSLRPNFRGGWLAGTAIFLAVVASWYVPAYLANRELFVQEFLIKQNVGRFTGGDAAHTVRGIMGWIFYIPILLLGTLPWIVHLKKAWPKRRSADPADAFLRYCSRWAWIVFLFFTISAAKLPHYILPVIPGLAIVVGAYLARKWQAEGHAQMDWRVLRTPVISSLFLFFFINAALYWYYSSANLNGAQVAVPHKEIHDLTRWARAQNLPIAVFQMPRRDKALATSTTRLQETSHPSIVFYARKAVAKVETIEELDKVPTPAIVLTRTGRLTPEVMAELANRSLNAVPVREELPQPQPRFYEAWRLDRVLP